MRVSRHALPVGVSARSRGETAAQSTRGLSESRLRYRFYCDAGFVEFDAIVAQERDGGGGKLIPTQDEAESERDCDLGLSDEVGPRNLQIVGDLAWTKAPYLTNPVSAAGSMAGTVTPTTYST